MKIDVKQISSLEKVRKIDSLPERELERQTAVAGQRVSYQLCLSADTLCVAKLSVSSPLEPYATLYTVNDAVMDTPVTAPVSQEDYITLEAGLMPDILVPLTDRKLMVSRQPKTVWVRLDLPETLAAGGYAVTAELAFFDLGGKLVETISRTMTVDVLPQILPEQSLVYTR